MTLQPYLKRIIEGRETLSRTDAAELLQTILRGEATELELAALLGSLATRGPAPTEIAGFVDTLRAAATPIPPPPAQRPPPVHTRRPGPASRRPLHLPPPAALGRGRAGATRGAELMVAKHGNRAVTSACGSA